jgi:ribonuclease BN (tRNA processing enzyme)
MQLQVLGCGDVFGSGGRFNTCFHVTPGYGGAAPFLVDCGASSLIAIRRYGVDPNAIGSIFISHLHGDHFAGLPFFLLDAQLVSRRQGPLTVAGPPGLRTRLPALIEAMFPGASTAQRRFELHLVELQPQQRADIGGITVRPFPVLHPSGAPSFALRFELGGKVLCYTGDTEWVEALVEASAGADLLIAECYTAERPVRYHLSWAIWQHQLPRITARRLLLTHLGPEMLGHPVEGHPVAEDGMVVEI